MNTIDMIFQNIHCYASATDRTWECRNKEGFFLEITEVLAEVRTNYFSNFFFNFFKKFLQDVVEQDHII